MKNSSTQNASSSSMKNRVNSALPGNYNKDSIMSKQSPKVKTGILRHDKKNSQAVESFSLADVNLNLLARGTKMHEQYERQNMNEYLPNELKDLLNTIDKSRDESNNYQVVTEKRKIRTSSHKDIEDFNQSRSDKWMPNGLKLHERLIRTARNNRPDPNSMASKLPDYSIREIKDKMLRSDIFFNKNKENLPEVKCQNNLPPKNKLDYYESDVFLLKHDETSLRKNGEKYLQRKSNPLDYTVSKPSYSEWHPKNSHPTLLNHVSTSHHILNPGIKHISKTKEDVFNESNGFNPIYRQKSLCEYIDLTRCGVPNPNRHYLEIFNKSNGAFRKKKNVCLNYLDLHHEYKGVSAQPFVKKII